MRETADAPAEQSLADYIRQENAKDRASAGLDGEGAPLPEAKTLSPSEAAVAADEASSTDTEPASAADPEPSADRNADGTFKPKRDGVQSRIDKAIAKQREAERKAEAAEARARELEA